MMLRPDAEIAEIRQHMEGVRRSPWIDRARQWWLVYLFHCTDISNAVSILCQGELLSRGLAET